MLFALIAVVMMFVALLWMLPTLLRNEAAPPTLPTVRSNLEILKEELAELDLDLAGGTLSQQQYDEAREDLERRALDDTREATPVPPLTTAPRWTALVMAAALPICSALLYLGLGNPAAIAVNPGANKPPSEHEIEAMVSKLAARMQQNPNDGNGWAMLGRSYLVTKRYTESAQAYAHAVSLIPNDADLLADYADALAMTQDRQINGEPLHLIERALKVDGNHWKSLAMAGSAAFERKDYKAAIGYWEKLRQRTDLDSEFIRTVNENIAQARQAAGMKPEAVAAGAAGAMGATSDVAQSKPGAASASNDGAAAGSVRGTVSLTPALAAKASPNDVVFIFARAVQGPRMPLAVMRRQVKDLPVTFDLNDGMSMSPEMKLSAFNDVVVGARISKAANAMPQSGDLQGASAPVKLGAAGIKVVIDTVVP